MRKPGEAKICGLSQEVTLAVLPRLFTKELLSELSRRNIHNNNQNKNREHLAVILKEVMVLEYKEDEEEERCPSPEIIDITDLSKVDDNSQPLQQSESPSTAPTDKPTCSTTDDISDPNSAFKVSDSNISFTGQCGDTTSLLNNNNNDNESVVCVQEVLDVEAPDKYLHGLSEIFSRSSDGQSTTIGSNTDAGEKQDDPASSVSLVPTQTQTGESEVYPVMLYQTVHQQNVASEDQEVPASTEESTSVGQNGTSEQETDCQVVSSESERQRIMRVISEAKAKIQSHLAGKGRKNFTGGKRGIFTKLNLLRKQQRKKKTSQTTTQSRSPDSQAATTHNTLLSTVSKEKERRPKSSNVGNPVVNRKARIRRKKCYICGVCGTTASTRFNMIRHMRRKHKFGQGTETMPSFEMLQVQESDVPVTDTDVATTKQYERFLCDQCGCQASTKFNLLRHKKAQHSGNKNRTTKEQRERPTEMVSSEKSLHIHDSDVQAVDVVQAGQTTTTEQLSREERPTEQTMSSEEDSLCMRDSNVQAVYRIRYIVQAGQTSTTTDQLSQEGRSVEQTMSSDSSEDSLRMCDSNVPAVDVVQVGQTTTTTATTTTEQVSQQESAVEQSMSSEEDSVRRRDSNVPAIDVVQAGQTTTTTTTITTYTDQVPQEERSVDQSVSSEEDSVRMHVSDIDVPAVDVVQAGQTTTNIFEIINKDYLKTTTTTTRTEQLSQEERSADQSVSSEEDSVHMHDNDIQVIDVVQVGQTTTTTTTTTDQLSQEERSIEQSVSPKEDSVRMHVSDIDVPAVDVVQVGQTATTTEQLYQEEMSAEQSMSSEEESLHDGDVQAIVDVAVWRRNKIFKCVECAYQTPLKTNLLLHKTRRHAVQTVIPTTKTPPQEEKPKSSSDGLPKTLTQLVKKLSTCEVCGFQTSSKSNLLRHKKRRHSNQALTPTTWTLSREGRLKSSAGGRPEVLIPVTPSTGKKLHPCDVCGIQCSTKSNLKRHKLRHVTGKPNKPSKSTDVGKSGPETQNTTEENVDTNNPTSIDINNPTSLNTNNLTSINANNPTSINANNPTSINANNLTSINASNLTSINANNLTSINANCLTIVDTNNPRRDNRSHLTTSFYAKSLKRPTYKCNLCEYTSAYQVTMRYHKMIHTGEKPFMCGTCGYRAKRKSTLAKHMRIHTGEKPYACDQCDYRAVQKAHLDRHVRRKHAMTSAPQ